MQMDFLASSDIVLTSLQSRALLATSPGDTACAPSLWGAPCRELPGDQVCASSSSSGHCLPFMDGALHS